jgi:D-alanyl-D-alanine carboxypeptidase
MRLQPLFAYLLLIAAPFSAVAADAPATVTPPKSFDLKEIDKYLAAHVKATGFVGFSVAIMKEGKIVFSKGYGKINLKSGLDVNEESLFGAGSVTKQFTCACILLLAEDGKLSVDDKVAKYYPGLTRAKEISIYDLMTHVSGYPDYYPLDFVDRRMEKTIALDKLIEEYAGGKLDFDPTTRWSYSNTGYIILGRIVEKVSGKSFAKFMEERVLKPAGLEHSHHEPDSALKNKATGYTSFFLGEPEEAKPEASGWIHAAGGLFTTPSDLAKWDLALMEGKVLKPESFALMTKPRKLADGRTHDYGCGLGIVQHDGDTMFRHGGAVSGFLAFNVMFPRTKSALVVMTNCDHLDAASVYAQLLTLLEKSQGPATPAVPKVKGLPAKEAALDFFHQMQSGEIKRDNLGEEFSVFLSEKRVAAARDRLKALGEPEKLEVEGTHERGGMEVAVIRFTIKGVKLKGSLYRTPDGKIQQFLLYKS